MRYIIYGAGAVGSCYGGLLHYAGKSVVLIGRTDHVQAIRQHGLILERIGETLTLPVPATDDVTAISPLPGDVILLAVKSPQTAEAIETLGNWFPSKTPIVSFQNGVRNESWLAERFQTVYSALVNFNGNYLGPGRVRRTIMDQVVFGLYPQGTDAITAKLTADARLIGFRSVEHAQVMNLKWGKLLSNINNATLALQGLWLQKALSLPENVEFMRQVSAEGMQVAEAAGIDFSDPTGTYDVRQQIDRMISAHRPGTNQEIPEEERSYPSTYQDLRLGRTVTEVDFLNGEIVKLGQQLGIPTPYNSTLLESVHQCVQEKSGPGRFQLPALKSLVAHKGLRTED
ncbi:MAG: ketopantoate reductase family protein [Blastocatellia bacterium]|nr:ketopantoate reductase family protein [Blastocatellia bacterium]